MDREKLATLVAGIALAVGIAAPLVVVATFMAYATLGG